MTTLGVHLRTSSPLVASEHNVFLKILLSTCCKYMCTLLSRYSNILHALPPSQWPDEGRYHSFRLVEERCFRNGDAWQETSDCVCKLYMVAPHNWFLCSESKSKKEENVCGGSRVSVATRGTLSSSLPRRKLGVKAARDAVESTEFSQKEETPLKRRNSS